MKPAKFSYHAPGSVDDAVALLGQLASEDGRILAGGQSLVPTMAFRVAQPGHLIDINGIPSLGTISVAKDRVRIGACVRHAAFEGKTAIPGPTGALLGKVVRNIAHYPSACAAPSAAAWRMPTQVRNGAAPSPPSTDR